MPIKIYHNTSCSKSRQAIALVSSKALDFEVIEYLNNLLTFEEIKLLLSQLNIKPIELIRTKESIWNENYNARDMNHDEIISTIVNHPKLIRRPIITNNEKAIIGSSTENVLYLFS